MRYSVFFYFLLLSVLGCIDSYSQVVLSRQLSWNSPREVLRGDQLIKTLSFKEQNATDEISLLPFVAFNLPINGWAKSDSRFSSHFIDTTWVFATPEENSLLLNKGIGNDAVVDLSIGSERKKNTLYVSVTPYREFSPGIFQKLTYLRLSVNATEKVNAPLKSAAAISSVRTYAANSVLSKGKWVKIGVTETGIHKISYEQLKKWGFASPENVKVFGNGGAMLPWLNSQYRADDLLQNKVLHKDNYLFFYAQGPVTWTYNSTQGMYLHELHNFSSSAFYFLSEQGTNSLVTSADYSAATASNESVSFDDYQYHEVDNENLFSSGRRWFGEKLDATGKTSYTYSFTFDNLIKTSPVKLYSKTVGRSNFASSLGVYLNDAAEPLRTVSYTPISIGDSEGYFAREGNFKTTFNATDNSFNLLYQYKYSSTTSFCWIDLLDVQARSLLKFNGGQLLFRDRESIVSNGHTKFSIQSQIASAIVWDVTSPSSPVDVNAKLNGSNIQFVYPNSDVHEFVAFNPTENLLSPTYIEEVSNQNLHGEDFVDYIIVAHPDYIEQANRLALLHQEYSGLSTLVVTPQMIYNEFSSGQPDVTAIRSLVKMFYDRAGAETAKMPKYLLLFGDGSFDNRPTTSDLGRIITFQSDNSVYQTSSYTTDDFFGFLDDAEGNNPLSNTLDIGIGRFPVSNISQATIAVDKVEAYLTAQTNDNWRGRITFIGDDGDSNIHMEDADAHAVKVNTNYPDFNVKKLYLDSYLRVNLSNGTRYPDVDIALEKTIADGTLVLNYTGHGGITGVTHEGIISNTKIANWSNINKLFFLFTATCDFSRYDMKSNTSAGEWTFLNPQGGAIALFTTSRIVYSNLNRDINYNFYDYIFEDNEVTGERLAFGDVVMKTKNATSNSVNKLNYTLLGDPALKLIYPEKHVITKSINNIPVDQEVPYIKALSTAKVSADVLSTDNSTDNSFNGKASVLIYDKPKKVATLANDGGTPFEYLNYESLLFNGTVSVVNGSLNSLFVVPQDINFTNGYGRVSYYATTDEDQAFGGSNNIPIGGVESSLNDVDGPDVKVWLDSKSFVNGDKVGSTPLFIADIYDENGINTSGNGIGHDLVLNIVNNDGTIRYVMNNYFTTDLDSYTSGSIAYGIPELPDGTYQLSLKAWDTSNNSSTTYTSFMVDNSISLSIKNVSLYANPLIVGSALSINFEHNAANENMDVDIRIFNLSGQLLSHFNQEVYSSQGTTMPITFTPSAGNGNKLGSGIYIVKIDIESESGKKSSVSQKMIISE